MSAAALASETPSLIDYSRLFTVEYGPPDTRVKERVRRLISVVDADSNDPNEQAEQRIVFWHEKEKRDVTLAVGPADEDPSELGKRARAKIVMMQRTGQL